MSIDMQIAPPAPIREIPPQTQESRRLLLVTPAAAEVGIELVRDDTYRVRVGPVSAGFVDRAGNVFVAQSGAYLSDAREIGQSLSWDEAVEMVRRSHIERT